jgi:two-component system sensor histidine kinase KdpD
VTTTRVLEHRLRAAPYLASAATVIVVGLAADVLTRFVSLPHVSVLFIASVVMSAAFWGFWPAVLAALLSVAAGSYFFYSPIFSFRVSAEQDLADLAVFVIVAAFTSRLAANVRAQALEAQRRRDAMAGLLAFNERLAESSSDADLHAAIVAHLAPVLGRPLHLLLPEDGHARVVASDGSAGESLPSGRRIELRAAASAPAGVVIAPQPGPPADPEYVKGLLGHAGLALERARLSREVAEARLKAQGEQLREALLNSVSHDLQTPLAAILGSATALESFAEHGTLQARRELVSTIREETERLTAYIENVLDLTRIRSGQIAARFELIELADIINAALRRKESQLRAHEVQVRVPADLPMLRLDPFLMAHHPRCLHGRRGSGARAYRPGLRHRGSGSAARVRGVLPRRRRTGQAGGRHGPGPRHLPRIRRGKRRLGGGVQRGRGTRGHRPPAPAAPGQVGRRRKRRGR